MPPRKPLEEDKRLDVNNKFSNRLSNYNLVPGKANYTAKNPGDMNFYTEEAPGLKVTPKTVLITSLVYLGIVVILHLVGKIGGSGAAPEAK